MSLKILVNATNLPVSNTHTHTHTHTHIYIYIYNLDYFKSENMQINEGAILAKPKWTN